MLKVLKRVLAIELCLIMFLALLPIGALAEEPTPPVVDPPAEVSEAPVVETPVIEKKEIVEEKKDEVVEEKKDEIIEEKKDEIVTEKKDETVEEKKDEIVGDKKDEVVEDKKDEIVDEKDKDEEETDEEEETILRHGQQEEESPASAPVLSLNKSSVTLAVGDEETLTCTATIDGESAEVDIDWSSSDESVATVDGGIVTAVAAGEATITASAEGATNVFCKVTVTGEPEEEVGLFMAMDLGEEPSTPTYALTITYQYATGGEAATTYMGSFAEGSEYSVTSPEIDGYTADTAAVSGMMGTEAVEATVTYTKIVKHTLSISYEYEDGTAAGQAYSAQLAEGESYSVESPSITNYEADVLVVSGAMGTKNVSVTVTYKIVSFGVTYKVLGADYKTVLYTVGEAVTAPEDPTPTGYTFTGWNAEFPFAMPAKDVVITANCTVNSYKMTYMADGKQYGDVANYDFGAAVTAPEAPELEGYTFTGWNPAVPATMPAEDLTVTAEFAPQTYTVTFTVEGTTTTKEVALGETIPLPEAPVSSDPAKVFDHWDANGVTITAASTMPASDLTVTAVFVQRKTATVTFKARSGNNNQISNWTQSGDTTITVTEKDDHSMPTFAEITKPTPKDSVKPNKTTYYFSGWSEAGSTEITNGMTVYAEYVSRERYWVQFAAGEHGTLSGRTFVTSGNKNDPVPTPGVIPIAGYVFIGWDKDFTSGAKYKDFDEEIITAQYAKTLTLTFLAGEHGKIDGKQTYTVSGIAAGVTTSVTTPEVTPDEGYVFTGWQPSVTGTWEEDASYTAQYRETPSPASIVIAGAESLPMAATRTYTASVLPAEAKQGVAWSLDDPDSTGATISVDGVLTAGKKTGYVTVKATSTEDGAVSGMLSVQIAEYAAATKIAIIAPADFLYYVIPELENVCNTMQLSAVVSPTEADQQVQWSVSSSKGATISQSGLLTAGSGSEKLTVTATDASGKVTATKEIMVKAPTGNVQATFYALKPGESIPDDASPQPATNYVECGKGIICFGAGNNAQSIYINSGDGVNAYIVSAPSIPTSIVDPAKNQAVRWYTIKYDGSDGWHVDGVVYSTTASKHTVCFYEEDKVTLISKFTVDDGGSVTAPTYEPDGYQFVNWLSLANGSVVNTGWFSNIKSDINVYAQLSTGTAGYKTQYYLQNEDGTYPATPRYTTENTGLVGKEVSAAITAFTGYTYDSQYADNISTGVITVNGGLVLKLYYARSYTIVYDLNGGTTASPQTTFMHRFLGENTPTITAPTHADVDGYAYTFAGWSPAVAPTVTGNATYVAQWEKTLTSHNLTIHYIYEGGAEAADDYAKAYDYNAEYSVASPAIAGYTPDKPTVKGTMGTADVEVTVTYKANTNTKYTVIHYLALATGGYQVGKTDEKTGTTGASVSAAAETFPGYTFDAATTGTQNQGTILGDGTLILKLYYSLVDYTITYQLAGGEIGGNAVDVVYEKQHIGDTTPKPSNPTRADANGIRYTFTGWSPAVAATVSGDAAYTAQWSEAKINYAVTYSYTSTPTGAPAVPNKSTATVGNTVTVEAAPTLAGYEFSGWTTTDATVTGGSFTMPSNDVAFTGMWTAIDYTITYSVSGDVPAGYTAPAQVTGKHVGDTYTVEAVPTEAGYTFAGWKYNNADTTTLTMPANHVTLTGVWTANAQTYTVRYWEKDADPANEIATAATKNTTFASVITSANEKIAITGFAYDSADKDTLTIGTDNETNVINLYYTRESYGYTIHHVELGNETNELADDTTGTAAFDALIDVAAAKKPISGFTYNSHSGNITIVVEATQNVATIYYARNAHTVTYAYTGVVPNGAQELLPAKAENIPFAQGMTVAGAPELAGYTFSDWTTTDATVENGSFTMPDQNVTFTGTWKANENTAYTVEHYQQNANDDGYTLQETESLTGTTGETATAVAKSYTGFTENTETALRVPSGMITGNGGLVLKLYYDRAMHTVTYAYDATAPENAPALPTGGSYRQGATVTVADDVSLAGYTFKGWNKTGTFEMPNNDVTITGSWEAIDYTISYRYTNTVAGAPAAPTATTTNHVGEAKTRAAAPELAGYTFSGWTTSDATVAEDGGFTMPSHDVAFTGTWMANPNTQYTVEFYLQNVDGTYPATATNSVTRGGETNTTATVTDADKAAPAGFALDDAATDKLYSGLITGDGKLKLKVFFKRGLYAVTYAYSGDVPTGAGAAPTEADQRYGATVTVKPAPTTPEGYTFSGWATSNATVAEDGSFTMPDAAVAFTGSFIPNTDTQYTVAFYYEDVTGGYPATATRTVTRGGTTNTTASVTDVDKAPAQTGFTLDDAAAHVYSGLITGDGNLVLKVLFKRNLHGITYSYTNTVIGAPALPAAESNIRVGTGKQVATAPELPGYTFSGWTTADAVVTGGSFTMPDQDVAFTGTWTPIAYTVTYQFTGTVPAGASALLPAQLTNRHVGDTITVANAPTLAGYTFDGWYKGTEKMTSFDMPTENVTLTGSWTAIDYTVTYQYTNAAPTGASDVPAQLTGKHVGDSITVAGQPESIPAGYTFDGWYNGNTLVTSLTMPANDVTLTGSWTPIDYTVTYQYTNTVTGAPDVPAQLTGKHVGDPITVADAPTFAGYTFSGWSTTDATVANNAFDMPAKSVVISGSWTPIDYMVTYQYTNTVAGAPTVPAQLTGKHVGDGITVAAVPELTGYTFDGWKYDGAVVTSVTMPADNIVLTGTWNPRTDTKYRVEYYQQNVENDNYTLYEGFDYTGTTDALVTAEAKGYEGFTYNASVAGTLESGNILPNGTLVLKRFYDRLTYPVKYQYAGTIPANPPKLPDELRYKHGATVSVAPAAAPAPDGYTFEGWDETGTTFTMPMGAKTITGTWSMVDYTVTYQYTNTVEGAPAVPATMTGKHVGDPITVSSPLPTMTGYTFDGWYKGTDITTAFDMPANHVTLTGGWNINSHTVTYLVDGQTYGAVDTYNFGATVAPLRAKPEKAGYTFTDWQGTLPATMPDNDIVISCTSTPIDYKVTYRYTGIVPTGAPVEPAETLKNHVGDPMTVATAPTFANYTFSGWTTSDATVESGAFAMPAKNVVFSGGWTANPYDYSVEYYYNGNIDAKKTTTAQAAFGTLLSTLAPSADTITANTKRGYTYTETVVTGSVTETAANNVIRVYYLGNGRIGVTLTGFNVDYDGNTHAAVPSVSVVTDGVTETMGWDAFLAAAGSGVGITYNGSGDLPKDATKGEDVYAIAISGKPATVTIDEIPYAVTYGTATGVIKPVTLTVRPDDATITVGDPTPSPLTYAITGYVAGEDATAISGTPVITALNVQNDVAGKYDIAATAGSLAAKNYLFAYEMGTLTILPKFNVTYVYTGSVPAGVTPPASAQVGAGLPYSIAALPAAVAGYAFGDWAVTGATAAAGAFVMPENDVTITLNWQRLYQLTIQYIYAATGVVFSTLDAGMIPEGTNFGPYISPEVAGYEYDRNYVDGTMPSANLTEQVFYTAIPTPPVPPEEPPAGPPDVPPETPPEEPIPVIPTITQVEDLLTTLTDDEGIALAGPKNASWALLNLILTIATAIANVLMLIGYFGKKEEKTEAGEIYRQIKKHGLVRVLMLVPTLGAIIAFILTENMNLPMVLVDRWTVLMLIIAAIQMLMVLLGMKSDKDIDSDDFSIDSRGMTMGGN